MLDDVSARFNESLVLLGVSWINKRLIGWSIQSFVHSFIHSFIHGLTDWLTDWLIDWLIGWLIDWLIDWSIDSINHSSIHPFIHSFIHWVSEWVSEWLIDWLFDWLIDWLIDQFIRSRLVDWLIDWLIDWLVGWSIDRFIHYPSNPDMVLPVQSRFSRPFTLQSAILWLSLHNPFPSKPFACLLPCAELSDARVFLQTLRTLTQKLPRSNRDVLERLVFHLAR